MKAEVQGVRGCDSEEESERISGKNKSEIGAIKKELNRKYEESDSFFEKDKDISAISEGLSEKEFDEILVKKPKAKAEYVRMECQIPMDVFYQSRKKTLGLHAKHFGKAEEAIEYRCEDPKTVVEYFDFLERGDGGR